ncbi:MAG: DNA polymerase III subunit delta [Desulfitobacteriaceae bacterium]|nr:DNA polymerase III subunit delta [Desulfitobacteriaceae bacterium]MDD4345990.1 DNA polymerase III subunit delta [Desulfitobacteriaceae bacterium]MDD4400381.1 DNA polymerase III subunit delta [Desulfitobacteriaceae bacterium]
MHEIESIREAVIREKVPLIYLWHGEDRFMLAQALQELKKYYLRQDPSGSGIEILAGRDIKPADIVNVANLVSFFQRRLVVVEDIPYFQEGHSESLAPFFRYFADPNPDTCLLFITEKVHKGRKFYKALAEAGVIYEFKIPGSSAEWKTWLLSELESRGKSMSPSTFSFFLDWAGQSPGVLSQELDKLAVYVGEEKTIQAEDIRSVSIKTVEANVFELLDAVAQRKISLALNKLNQVLREEHPLKILTLLVRQARLLLGACIWRSRGENVAGLTAALGIKSAYEARKIWTQSQRMSAEQLVKALQECLKTEIALKTGAGNPVLLLELMLVKFCR